MNELDKLRLRIVELELAAKEGLKTIEWFESWLNDRDEPIRYLRDDLEKNPPRYTVNYAGTDVAQIKMLIVGVLGS